MADKKNSLGGVDIKTSQFDNEADTDPVFAKRVRDCCEWDLCQALALRGYDVRINMPIEDVIKRRRKKTAQLARLLQGQPAAQRPSASPLQSGTGAPSEEKSK